MQILCCSDEQVMGMTDGRTLLGQLSRAKPYCSWFLLRHYLTVRGEIGKVGVCYMLNQCNAFP